MRADWVECRFGDFIKFKNGYAFKSSEYLQEGIPVIRIGDISQNEIRIEDAKKIKEKEEYKDFVIGKGDILIAMSGATTGKFGLYNLTTKAYLNQRVGKIQPKSESTVYKPFIFYLLHFLKRQIEKDAYGGAQPNISSKKIEEMKVPFPPLPEQRAIVKKIEALFSSLDNGIADLKKAQQQLKIFRQAVLKKAFEGELTTVSEREIANLGTLLLEKPRYGTSKKCSDLEEGTPVLRIPNIGNGVINSTELKYANFDENELQNLKLEIGDILTIRSNGSVDLVGKSAIITPNDLSYLFAGYLIRLRPNANLLNSKFLLYCLSSHNLRVQIESKAKSTSGVNNINSQELQSLQIPLFSLEEQHEIVKEIESRLSVCDAVEVQIRSSLQQAEALRQSILKKSFEGKLLTAEEVQFCKQEPDYEPASVLLERIKAEQKVKSNAKK